jgi:hypothetical protein
MERINAGFEASGTIQPSTIVKISGNFTVAMCGANEAGCGIVGPETRAVTDSNPNAHAVSGEPVSMHNPGEVAYLTLAGTVTAGDFIKSDAAGEGVAIATTGTTAQNVVAQALQSGVDNDVIRVRVLPQHKVYPALA